MQKPWRRPRAARPGRKDLPGRVNCKWRAKHGTLCSNMTSTNSGGNNMLRSLICVVAASAVWLSVQLPARAEKLVLVAGGGDGADGSSAVGGQLRSPFGVHFDRAGNMY